MLLHKNPSFLFQLLPRRSVDSTEDFRKYSDDMREESYTLATTSERYVQKQDLNNINRVWTNLTASKYRVTRPAYPLRIMNSS